MPGDKGHADARNTHLQRAQPAERGIQGRACLVIPRDRGESDTRGHGRLTHDQFRFGIGRPNAAHVAAAAHRVEMINHDITP